MRKYSKFIALITIVCFVAGCATIVGDKTQLIGLQSTPASASVTITDEKGSTVFSGATPTNVTLEKADGTYFGGKTYIVRISKEGYESQSVQISSKMNAWYLAGNLVFGGLIGWFIVDPLTGSMYNLSPDQINPQLAQQTAKKGSPEANSIHIVLLEDVPQHLRSKMTKIK